MKEQQKILAIINPISGTSNKDKLPRLINEVLGSEAHSVQVETTRYAGHGRELAAQAVTAGIDIVVAIGGDGTVNEVGSALCNTDTALAIVPIGSGNGLARHLRLPMNTARALQVINDGRIEAFDYCTVNDHPFFCTCGLGFDAQVSYKFSMEGTRGFITYVKTAISEYFKYKSKHYRIDIDGTSFEKNAFVVACCNAAQYGNNAYIAPRATMHDGLVDMTVMHQFNLAESALIGTRLFTRSLDQDKHVSIYRGKHIVIEREAEDVIHIDGDPIVMPARIDVISHHRGIHIIVPPTLEQNV